MFANIRRFVVQEQQIVSNNQFLFDLFTELARNKGLPKYQFERRVDILLTMFLPEILFEHLSWQVELVAPEFPLKRADNNQSTNVDHLLFRRAEHPEDERWLFFELKTDDLSVRDSQIEIYKQAIGRGMPVLRQQLQSIQEATTFGKKYNLLAERLAAFPLERPIELVYLAPTRIDTGRLGLASCSIAFAELAQLELKRYSDEWQLFRSIILPALTNSETTGSS
jgi:hypothetical protein